MTKICPGCGSEIQYTDINKVGYSPKKGAELCERCFKLKNYNQKQIIELKYNNDDIIDLINKSADNALFITDFLSLSNKVIDIYKRINTKNKTLVINKVDYIPNSINKEKYINWIKETYLVNENIVLLSASKNYNIRVINNLLVEGKNNYICGFTNSGKSTIINKLCELNEKDSSILTSLMPNTTLDVIKIKLDEKKYVFDTPGFINDFEFNDKLYPRSFLKPIILQIKENDVVSINDKIITKSDVSNCFIFYMSNDLNIKKIYNNDIKLNKEIKIDNNSDLVIDGYGFINIKNPCTLITNLNEKDIEIRTSMF